MFQPRVSTLLFPSLYHRNKDNPDPYFICETDHKMMPRKCYNRYKTDIRAYPRCLDVYKSTNATMLPEQHQFIVDGVQDWLVTFDIFMRFPCISQIGARRRPERAPGLMY